MDSPCLTCGACCAALRVGFPERQTTRSGGPVPFALTEPWIPGHRRMRGTADPDPRCVALEGPIGAARCGIYPRRPEPCRDLAPGDPHCLAARARHGLPPLPP